MAPLMILNSASVGRRSTALLFGALRADASSIAAAIVHPIAHLWAKLILVLRPAVMERLVSTVRKRASVNPQ
jgi:hypothetical protein